jgi:hypothetical protein
MRRSAEAGIWKARRFRATLGLCLLLIAGCGGRPVLDSSVSPRLSADVWAVLDARRPSNEFHRARARLEEMGPEVDSVLVSIAENPAARAEVRGNALVLLADRRSPLALQTLERALRFSENERIRSAAVLGLNRLSTSTEQAFDLIRLATGDRSRNVRLAALQSLDSRDIATMRSLLERETDPEVRLVALQLVSLAESRGAALASDPRGALRTARGYTEPQIVFRPVTVDSASRFAIGDLRLEMPDGPDIPLVPAAEVIGNVVPAFFSPDRSAVVYEYSGEIRVLDVASRHVRQVGPGIAPRLIPFTHQFVFLRERPANRRETDDGLEIVYDVLRSNFGGMQTQLIGEIRSWSRPELNGGANPVRWMVVGEAGDGFVLRGDGVETFGLPTPVWRPGRPDGPSPGQSGAPDSRVAGR